MTPKESSDIQRAIDERNGGPIQLPGTRIVAMSIDYYQQMAASQDLAAIQQGIEQMERGDGVLLAEADAQIRKDLGFPPRT